MKKDLDKVVYKTSEYVNEIRTRLWRCLTQLNFGDIEEFFDIVYDEDGQLID